MTSPVLAIDFGTSNSAAALLEGGKIRRIAIETGAETLPTAVFFPAQGGPMRIGEAAAQALIEGYEGRYMRALKSVLGTPLLHETRLIGGRRRSIAQVIAAFLESLRTRAEAETGTPLTRALSGRPVHFHSDDPARDHQAEADLRGCYLAAGFTDVDFLPEPEAAALAIQHLGQDEAARAGQQGGDPALGLVVDIGGGTSDFTLFRTLSGGGIQVLASHGIRLGGTDFDQAVSVSHVMPMLGLGSSLRREMGEGLLPVPQGLFHDLATWARIPFLYTPETRRLVAGMLRLSVAPEKLGRLDQVLRDELGHDLAFAVEAGKIAANGLGPDGGPAAAQTGAAINMAMIARGLGAPIDRASLDACLAPAKRALTQAAAQTLALADTPPEAVGRVILVGGSSLMGLVAEAAQALCPRAALLRSEAFTAVIDGLALATAPGSLARA